MGTMVLILVTFTLLVGIMGLLCGFLLCGILVLGRRADLERTLSAFANPDNWLTEDVIAYPKGPEGTTVWVWNGAVNPVEIARTALE